MAHVTTIQIYRGAEAGIPTLAAGELGFTTDTYKLFVGDGAANHEIGGGSAFVSDTAYDEATWNGVTTIAPSKNAVRDYLNILGTAAFTAATAYQPIDATLTAFSALTIAANTLTVGTGADAFLQTEFAANTFPARASAGDLVAKTITDFGLSLVDDAAASDARTTLGGTTVGQAHFTLTNPSAVRFVRINADNSVDALSASDFRTAIGAGTGGFTNPMTTLGDIIYEDATPVSARLAGNILAQRFALGQTGTGAVSAVPAWTPIDNGPLKGGYITATASAGALTISVLTRAGNAPSSGEPVYCDFRSATAAIGSITERTITGALTLTVTVGSTLGFVSSVGRVWVVVFDDAATLRIGVFTAFDGILQFFALREEFLESSTAIAGAGGEDAAGVFYAGQAVSSKPFRILGYLDFAGISPVGTWIAPTKIQQYGPGISLPGAIVQRVGYSDAVKATGATAWAYDDTIPQSGEGNQFMSLAITPKSGSNALRITTETNFSASVGQDPVSIALFLDSGANAIKSGYHNQGGGVNNRYGRMFSHITTAGTTSAQTWKLRAGISSGATTTFNGNGGNREFGGTLQSTMYIEEIQA